MPVDQFFPLRRVDERVWLASSIVFVEAFERYGWNADIILT